MIEETKKKAKLQFSPETDSQFVGNLFERLDNLRDETKQMIVLIRLLRRKPDLEVAIKAMAKQG